MFKVLCCGGRNFNDYQAVCNALDAVRRTVTDRFAVIHGGAQGADALSGLWARSKGFPEIIVPANFAHYSKGAGHIRNGWMVELCAPDYCVAFPGGNGTADMVAKCSKADIIVWKVEQ